MKRYILAIACVAMMSSVFSISSFAGAWQKAHKGWWYKNDDASYPKSQWMWIDGNGDGISERYYFDKEGYCLLDTIAPDGNKVNANGAWTMGGKVQTKGGNTNKKSQKQCAP